MRSRRTAMRVERKPKWSRTRARCCREPGNRALSIHEWERATRGSPAPGRRRRRVKFAASAARITRRIASRAPWTHSRLRLRADYPPTSFAPLSHHQNRRIDERVIRRAAITCEATSSAQRAVTRRSTLLPYAPLPRARRADSAVTHAPTRPPPPRRKHSWAPDTTTRCTASAPPRSHRRAFRNATLRERFRTKENPPTITRDVYT